ncbi:ABC transporter substrate-binding protein [Corynebacterium crudilactis]|uniref:Solute-binding protein family 5 domain-containing protein n=1 Tax=Corynebacterium crudilactis TaxID=1652495 RepID=A0A172QWC8_9CORY|nr:ABC transporter substrate-binding protein [Corynebacterium crudilactis]ANE05013.1 hypothetical protein ccrud_12935 [Corynebacterium crudilactis]
MGVLAAVLSVIFLTSCTSAVGLQTTAVNGEPIQGGIVHIGTDLDLNPATFYTGQITHTGLVYDTLTRYNPDSLEPQPSLAKAWELSPDGRTISLDLRDDVTFHSRRPLTSEDIKFSLVNYSDPKNSGQLARVAQAITSYDTSDTHRIKLHLDEPINNLFDLFDIVPIIDHETADQLKTGEQYNGTGPFRFIEWLPGSHAKYEANKSYWGGSPNIDGVEVMIVPDKKTQFAQLRSGQVDITAAQPRDAEALADHTAFRTVTLEGTSNITYLGVNVAAAGLDDPRVRQAISLAVDRDRILNEVYRGRGQSATLPWPQYSPAFDASTQNPSRDVARARELIAEVGSLPEFPISVPSNSPTLQTAVEIISSDLAEIGIQTKIVPTEGTTMTSQLINGAYPGLWVYSHTFSQYNPSTLVTAAFPFNSAKNSSNFLDAKYSSDVTQAWRIPDPNSSEAIEAYKALNQDLLDHNFVIELTILNSELITAGNLQGIQWDKRGLYDLSKAYFTQ